MNVVKKFRDYRSKKLEKLARSFAKFGVKANHLTLLSFLSGAAAIYFLFNNYYLFTLFTLLHLIFDGFDGVVARVTKSTISGKYFDLLSDNTVTFLALLKTGFYLQDFYAYIAATLFLLALIIHLKSKLQAPMIFIRTASVIVLIIATYPLFSFQKIILTAGYLIAGGVSLFSLSKQLQWYIQKKY